MENKGAKFYYSRMDDREKQFYDRIAGAVLRFKPEVPLGVKLSSVVLRRVIEGVIFDNPSFFYLETGKVASAFTPLGMKVKLSYDYTEQEAEELWVKLNARADEIISAVTAPTMSTLEKQMRIHKELCKIRRAKEPYCREDHSAVGGLLRGRCVCDGYAFAYKFICDRLHIASIVATGIGLGPDGSSEAHAWNITRIDSVTAHIDCSWDADLEGGAYDYFNLSDDEISKNHIFDRTRYPACLPNNINYFSVNRMTAANEAELSDLIAANRSRQSFCIRLGFPFSTDMIKKLPFPKGSVRYNSMQNVLGFTMRIWISK